MKTAVITGISSDMAQALKGLLEKDDWKVIGLSRQEVDLAKHDDVVREAEKLRQELPQIDAIVHFAGIWHNKDKALAGMKIEEFTPEQIADTMNVALTNFMILVSQLRPNLTNGAAIVGISGTFENGGADWLPYFVSKRGLEDFLVGLAQEQASLRVFGISPSDTNTKPYAKLYPEDAAQGQSPEVVAGLAAELLNGATTYASGDVIRLKKAERSEGYHV